ncbi:MAG: hypothetical protein FJ271_23885 [Planctomycetes bacterium]|nr:hypothetical protein [Planctomycetota bacterium]
MSPEADHWTERVRQTLRRYEPGLLRQVAGNLCRPRNQWPVDELIERSIGILTNPAVLDRRLKELEPASRRLLAMIAHSRQNVWRIGSLVELTMATGAGDGLAAVMSLLDAGLLYPGLPDLDGARKTARLKSFEQWLTVGETGSTWAFAHPVVCARALGGDLGLPDCPGASGPPSGVKGQAIHEADGLEWPLRLSALWQQVSTTSLRQTQQGDFFKRDLERLRGDPLLAAVPGDGPSAVPDPGMLAAALAVRIGLLKQLDGELKAGGFPEAWYKGLPAALLGLWSALPHLDTWNTDAGHQPGGAPGNPFPSAYLLCLLLLGKLLEQGWADPEQVAAWVRSNHPYWKSAATCENSDVDPPSAALARFLTGLAYSLRMVQAIKSETGWLIRLSPHGRWLLGMGDMGDAPPATPQFAQTLLVQPNLEILAYRQGLTPDLIVKLSQFAAWKTLGAACTLQLQPESVYRALEAGESFETIVQVLEGRGMKATPTAVLEALRTWSNKRDRIQVYPSASLMEFASAGDLQEALSRGLPAVRLTDRLAVVANEEDIDFRHFRMAGTRDYCLPPEPCVTVEADGVTLNIDQLRSDLLLETELQRFAESVPHSGSNGKLQYRLTPSSLAAARQAGTSLENLAIWYMQRCGQEVPPAVYLLLAGADAPSPRLERHMVLSVATPVLADGLLQWPETRRLIHARLGPTALSVAEDNVEPLRERLRGLGIEAATTSPQR